MAAELPTARLEVRNAAGRAERFGAVAKHGARRAVPVVRAVVATIGFLAIMLLLGLMSAVTRPHHGHSEMPRYQLPKLEIPQIHYEPLPTIERPVYLQHETP